MPGRILPEAARGREARRRLPGRKACAALGADGGGAGERRRGGGEAGEGGAGSDDRRNPADAFVIPPSLDSLFDDEFFRTPFDDDLAKDWTPQEQLEQMRKRMNAAPGTQRGLVPQEHRAR